MTIAAIAAGSPDFTLLAAFLETAELTAALDDPEADLTVLAPTDAAFVQLAADLGYDGDSADLDAVAAFLTAALADLDDEGDAVAVLTDVLLYHVSPGAKSASQIFETASIDTLLEGAAITAQQGRLIDLEPDLLDASIASADIAASNGTIQAIDRVLVPLDIPGNDTPSILDIAAGTPGFEVLAAALEAAGLDELFDDPDAEFTVFAPTDAAFANLAVALGFEGDTADTDAVFAAIADGLADLAPDDDPIPLLADILSYHSVPEALSVAALAALPSVGTLLPGALVIVTGDGTVIDAEPEVPNPAFVEGLTDLPASNGTVQPIDGVLLPLDLPDPAPAETIADIVAASGDGFDGNNDDFDILLAALTAADLVSALGGADDDFTLFAPTDAAFQSLAAQLGGDGSTEEAAFDSIVAALTTLSGEAADPIPLLSSVLLYHVIDGSFSRTELAGSPALASMLGSAPSVDGAGLTDEDPGFADASFIDAASDIRAANGLLQAIDEVLLPLNVPDATDAIGTGDDDVLAVSEGILVVDGGSGTDIAVFAGPLEATAFGYIDGGFTATTDGTSVALLNLESFQFADETVTVSDDPLAASVFRLYGVGLGREGDIAGVTFWTDVAAEDGLDMVAEAILASDEFLSLFGGEVPNDDEIVEEFYGNFLGRAPDEAGEAFWQNAVDTGVIDTAGLLLAFAESPEFRNLTENTTDDGVLLLA
ncbi:fasciclin domain-containing protein [Paralimibaculum aggregatum]|nr:fasciclin domain-containing protein [Limibaculum sp. NKW23]